MWAALVPYLMQLFGAAAPAAAGAAGAAGAGAGAAGAIGPVAGAAEYGGMLKAAAPVLQGAANALPTAPAAVPAVASAATEGPGFFSKLKTGWENAILGPGGANLSPDDRSAALWRARLGAISTGLRGGGVGGAIQTGLGIGQQQTEQLGRDAFIRTERAKDRSPGAQEWYEAMQYGVTPYRPPRPERYSTRRETISGTDAAMVTRDAQGNIIRQEEPFPRRAPGAPKAREVPYYLKVAKGMGIDWERLTPESRAQVRKQIEAGSEITAEIKYVDRPTKPQTYQQAEKDRILKAYKDGTATPKDRELAKLLFGGNPYVIEDVFDRPQGP
jgi:hypothetical protein